MDLRNIFGVFKVFFPQISFGFMGTTAAILTGGLLAAGGTAVSAAINSSAQDDAATAAEKQQRESMAQQERLAREGMAYAERQANQGLDFQKLQYENAQKLLNPYNEMQLRATKGLEGLTDPNNPIYQQRRNQMTQALQQQLAAQGLLRSKNQTDLLTNMELGLEEQRLGVQQGLAGLGASQGLANLATNYGGNVAQMRQNLGSQIGSQFGALGQNAMQSGQTLAQLNANRILAQGQNTAGMISGFTNIGGNMLSGIQTANQNKLMNDRLDKQNEFQNQILASLLGK
jgi:hypothetical protein